MDYKIRHYIPDDVDLNFQSFKDFLARRNQVILVELRKVLT